MLDDVEFVFVPTVPIVVLGRMSNVDMNSKETSGKVAHDSPAVAGQVKVLHVTHAPDALKHGEQHPHGRHGHRHGHHGHHRGHNHGHGQELKVDNLLSFI